MMLLRFACQELGSTLVLWRDQHIIEFIQEIHFHCIPIARGKKINLNRAIYNKNLDIYWEGWIENGPLRT